VEWDFDKEKAKQWLPANGSVFPVKVTSRRFGKANRH